MKKWDYVILALIISEYVFCFLVMGQMSIFRFMIFGQVLPAILLAILGARIASNYKFKWGIVGMMSILYAVLMYILLISAPMQMIENNTIQSGSSTFEFNREIGLKTYLGLFIQQFILTAFITVVIGVVKKIKAGEF